MYDLTSNLYDLFWSIFQTCCIVGAIAALLLGIFALANPKSFRELCKRVNYTVISPASQIDILDRPRFFDWYLYRNHKVVGFFLTLSAAFVSYMIMATINHAALRRMVDELFQGLWPPIFLELAMGVLYMTALLGFAFGLVLLFRPSALRNVENLSNHWIAAGDMLTRQMEKEFDSPDRWVEKNPRLFGLLDVGGAMFVLFVMLNTF